MVMYRRVESSWGSPSQEMGNTGDGPPDELPDAELGEVDVGSTQY